MLDMTSIAEIPFKAGQRAEERSFIKGYRGAWFKCKIKEISKRKNIIGYISEYDEFPDQKLQWTRLYQVAPCVPGIRKHKVSMLRPKYPPIYKEKEMPHLSEISEVTVIVRDSWKVGDLVDWWKDNCFWSGKLMELFDDQEAQLELTPPPLGFGGSDRVHLNDLRPSLDWSFEHGWTLPTQEDSTCQTCRLIKPINQGQESKEFLTSTRFLIRSSFSSQISSSSASSSEVKSEKISLMYTCSQATTLSNKQKDDLENGANQGCDGSIRKRSHMDANSGQMAAAQEVEVVEDDLNRNLYNVSTGGILNSKLSDTSEALILDLEEYLNKVKWLKKLLQRGISSSQNQGAQWEFVEPHGVSETL